MDAFQRGLIELLPRLRRLGRVLTRNFADADDLVQSAIERALARRDRWRPATRLDSWVFRIMKNAWIDETRARRRSRRVLAPEEDGLQVADAAQPAAVAACLVAGVAVFQALAPLRAPPMITAANDGLTAQGPLAVALDRQLVSDGSGAEPHVRIGLSFRAGDGRYCRTFQLDQGGGLAGLACREPHRWRVVAAMAAPMAPAVAGYRTAASPLPPALLTAVDGLIAGQALDAAAERRAKQVGWRS